MKIKVFLTSLMFYLFSQSAHASMIGKEIFATLSPTNWNGGEVIQAFESGGKIVSSSSVEYTGIYRYEHYDNTFFDMSVSVDFFDDYFLISAEAVDPSAWLLSSGVLASGIHSNLLFNVSFSGVEFTNVKASLDWGLTSPYSSEYFNDTGLMSISYNGTETTVATLDVKRDGSTLGFRVSEVPLPPSILLFTSSLIVLLGFKRSKKIS